MDLISQSLSPASIPALAALCGSVVGALGSSVGQWIAQQHRSQRELIAKEVFHREQLYSDFVGEAARTYADAIQHTLYDPVRLIGSYALLSRMRLSCSTKVVESAQRVLDVIINTYSKPNLTPEEFHAFASDHPDPLREFSSICRGELEALWSRM